MELIEKIVQILQIWSLGKSPTSKIFLFTSTKVQSAEKMNSKKNVPIKEDCPFQPSSPYAVSKTTQDHLGYTYWRCYNLKIIRS